MTIFNGQVITQSDLTSAFQSAGIIGAYQTDAAASFGFKQIDLSFLDVLSSTAVENRQAVFIMGDDCQLQELAVYIGDGAAGTYTVTLSSPNLPEDIILSETSSGTEYNFTRWSTLGHFAYLQKGAIYTVTIESSIGAGNNLIEVALILKNNRRRF